MDTAIMKLVPLPEFRFLVEIQPKIRIYTNRHSFLHSILLKLLIVYIIMKNRPIWSHI